MALGDASRPKHRQLRSALSFMANNQAVAFLLLRRLAQIYSFIQTTGIRPSDTKNKAVRITPLYRALRTAYYVIYVY